MGDVDAEQTLESDLAVLLNHLPRRRLRLMGVVLLASFFQGLLDMLLVGLMARMVVGFLRA